MSRSHGTGYPIYFHCPVARRERNWSSTECPPYPRGHDRIVRTGRTKPAPSQNKGHPRKLSTSHEYECSCGHVGWTCHVDILGKPVKVDAP